MKKLISIIAIVLMVMITVFSAYAVEQTREVHVNADCHHNHASESDITACPDCGLEVYICKTCGKANELSDERCALCNTKRAALTPEEKAEKYIRGRKINFYVFLAVGVVLFVLSIIFLISVTVFHTDYSIIMPFLMSVIAFYIAYSSYRDISPFI